MNTVKRDFAEDKQRLDGLQSLRGLAAYAVVFQHVTFYSCQALSVDYLPYLRVDFGRVGVQLFFVLSGFVMSRCLSQGWRFLLNRVLRIYPGYWLSLAISSLILSGATFGWTFEWRSFFLIPAPLNNSYRVPYWTLVYEVAFYLVVYICVIFGAKREAVIKICIAWLVAVIIFTKYVTISQFEPGALILFSKLNVYFIFGLLMGLFYEHTFRLGSAFLAVASAVLWCIGDTFAGAAPLPSDLMLALAFGGVVLLGARHIHVPALETLGDASYGVYLLHVPIAVLVTSTLKAKLPSIGLAAMWAITMVAASVGAFLFGWLENRIHGQIKRLTRARTV